ncbi:hypothetical protein AX14_001105 [Amanita brunnescens Koide BX004]|nr:hypothetical protein AX14_001105 [Amanita brunnescens Koide BX004]
MFLHALLFFLLSPSVFAAPAGSSSRGHGNDESYVGYWYPVEAKGTALGGLPQILQIVSETILYDRKLKEDGSLDERQSARTRIPTNKPDAITAILAPRVLWRRFPKGGTAYADLKYLKIQKGNGQQLTFNSPSLNEATGKYIVDWVGRYWYKITESGPTPVSK